MVVSKKKLALYCVYLQMICYSLSKLLLYGRGTWISNSAGNFYRISASVSSLDQNLLVFSAILGILASIIMILSKRNGMSRIHFVCGALIFIVSVMWTIFTVMDAGISPILVGNFPPSVFLALGVILIGYDEELFAHFSKVCGVFATAFFIISLYFAVQFVILYGAVGVRFGTSHVIYFFQMGLWTLAVYVLGTDTRESKNLKIVLLIICTLLSVIILSRGWIIQTGILFILYVMKLNKSQGKKVPMKGLVSFVCIIAVLSFIAEHYLSDQWATLLTRSTEDTRTQQIIQFFQQVNAKNLIIGGGYSASYSWLGRDYGAIDNQILLMMFRYGIIVTVLYLAIFVVPVFGAIKRHRIDYLDGINMMWLLAMAGLSIYCTINIDVTQMVVLVVAGRNIKGCRNRKEQIS